MKFYKIVQEIVLCVFSYFLISNHLVLAIYVLIDLINVIVNSSLIFIQILLLQIPKYPSRTCERYRTWNNDNRFEDEGWKSRACEIRVETCYSRKCFRDYLQASYQGLTSGWETREYFSLCESPFRERPSSANHIHVIRLRTGRYILWKLCWRILFSAFSRSAFSIFLLAWRFLSQEVMLNRKNWMVVDKDRNGKEDCWKTTLN